MNVNMNSSSALAQYSGDAVGMAVLKTAISIEAQGAMALIAATAPPQQNESNLPPNLGQNINVTA